MELKTFNKEKEYQKLQRNSKGKVAYITSLFSVCAIAIVVTFILTNSFAFKSEESFILADATVANLVWDYTYTGNAQEFTVPYTGYYNIELWGAGGGIRDYFSPSLKTKGGYTKGTIYLEKDDSLYFYVGNDGGIAWTDISAAPAAYNGGSIGGFSHCENGVMCPASYVGGGGGATDVRIISGSWNDSTSLRSRIMVAGAGGGGGGYTNLGNKGVGGGLIAASGGLYVNSSCWNGVSPASSGIGGTPNSGYAFGYGGNGAGNMVAGGGGGSGYYGGTGGNGSPSCASYNGGGGSSYISGYSGVNSVQEIGGTVAQPLHTNNTIHYSGKYFLNGKMESGTNTGNGKAKISYVGKNIPTRTNTKLNNVRYIKSCSSGVSHNYAHWVELQAIRNGVNLVKGITPVGTVASANNTTYSYNYITDGNIDYINSNSGYGYPSASGIQCITIDLGNIYNLDEVVLWFNWHSSEQYQNNTLSVGSTNVSGTASLSTILHNYPGTTGYAETSQGRRYTAWD